MLTALLALIATGSGFAYLAHVATYKVAMPPPPRYDKVMLQFNRRMIRYMYAVIGLAGVSALLAMLLTGGLLAPLLADGGAVLMVAGLGYAVHRYCALVEEARLCGVIRPRLHRDNA